MHDRRIEGEAHSFGNLSVLYKNAMTWWDHETRSVWSQPWGAAIGGELEGTRLTLLPFELVPWKTWVAQHPGTKVLVSERGTQYNPIMGSDGFVIGVSIRESVVGFYFASTAKRGVVNERVGDVPVAVFADGDTRAVDIFLRRPPGDKDAPEELEFEIRGDDQVIDTQTGSRWDINRGLAVNGPLAGMQLQRVPFVSAWDWAWEDFNPETKWWGSRDDQLRE